MDPHALVEASQRTIDLELDTLILSDSTNRYIFQKKLLITLYSNFFCTCGRNLTISNGSSSSFKQWATLHSSNRHGRRPSHHLPRRPHLRSFPSILPPRRRRQHDRLPNQPNPWPQIPNVLGHVRILHGTQRNLRPTHRMGLPTAQRSPHHRRTNLRSSRRAGLLYRRTSPFAPYIPRHPPRTGVEPEIEDVVQRLIYLVIRLFRVDDLLHDRIILYTQSENQKGCALGPTSVFPGPTPLQPDILDHPLALHLPPSHYTPRELRHWVSQEENNHLEYSDVLRALHHQFPFRHCLDRSSTCFESRLVRLQASFLRHRVCSRTCGDLYLASDEV